MPLLNTFNSVSVRGFAAPPIPGPSGPVAFVTLNSTGNTNDSLLGLDNGNAWIAGGTLPGNNLSSTRWYALATNGSGQYVAIRPRINSTSREAAYSNDNGNTWTGANLIGARFWSDVAYGNGVYIAISGNANSTTTRNTTVSADGGATWTYNSASLPVGANTATADTRPTSYRSINYGNGVFIATATNSNSSIIARSTNNGTNWSAVGVGSLANTATVRSWGPAVSDGNNRWVMTNYDGSNRAAYSTDNGQTWTTTTNLPIITAGSPLSDRPYYDMAYGNGVWVATNWGNVAVTADGGVSWATYSTAATGASWCFGIAYSNGVFAIVATGSPANVIITSSDNGQTWTKRYDLPSGWNPLSYVLA